MFRSWRKDRFMIQTKYSKRILSSAQQKTEFRFVPTMQASTSLKIIQIENHSLRLIYFSLLLIRNIVSTVNLTCKLDLKKIALHARNAEYNPKRFAAVIMRIREPRTTALIFSSGKMVCTGAKSEEDSRLAARKYARIIQKLGFPVSSFMNKNLTMINT